MPVLCNHCSNAACVEACPVRPKAIFKTADGITMHNDERCIGCRRCQAACPYSALDVTKENAQYSVLSFNDFGNPPHAAWRDESHMIPDCTASGAETAIAVGGVLPSENKYVHPDYQSVRRAGIVEKCYFCDHRLKEGLLPRCVEACPAKARVFGDLADPSSEAAQLLKKYAPTYLKPEKGTKPNVAYIRSYYQAKKS
jgi:Fe-S-cluster-containing dehydrogenase component